MIVKAALEKTAAAKLESKVAQNDQDKQGELLQHEEVLIFLKT
jgi:hypothetical protein